MTKLLIADDDPVMVKLLEFNLRRGGFTLVQCREGLSVVTQAREHKPSLAIFDYMLPGRSGLELIQDFRSDPELEHTPIIVVTGQGKGSTKDELLAAGANEVFTKPFSPTLLLNRINELIVH
jgi:two-component system alkaline phosphatase synthesis response regulator PhoP